MSNKFIKGKMVHIKYKVRRYQRLIYEGNAHAAKIYLEKNPDVREEILKNSNRERSERNESESESLGFPLDEVVSMAKMFKPW